MRAMPKETRLTTKKSTRGRPKLTKNENTEEKHEAMEDATIVPQQEPENTATKKVFMTVK